MTKRPSPIVKPIPVEMVSSKRRLEPLGVYDPYRPRSYGTANEILDRRLGREFLDMEMTNEAFATEKQREIAARTRAIAEQDAAALEASLEAERRARKFRVTRS